MERVTQEDWDRLRAGLARTPEARPAPEPQAAPQGTNWYPDSWAVIAWLCIACWPAAVWTDPVARWVALSAWWVFLALLAAGARNGRRS